MSKTKKFHIALPSPPAALAICAMVFSRRRGGITSNLQRFVGRSSACFCRNSTQYNLYIAKTTRIYIHTNKQTYTYTHTRILVVIFRERGVVSAGCRCASLLRSPPSRTPETKSVRDRRRMVVREPFDNAETLRGGGGGDGGEKALSRPQASKVETWRAPWDVPPPWTFALGRRFRDP